MEKVKAGLRGLNASHRLALGKVVLEKLTGNPHFPGIDAMLAELDQANTQLAETINAAMDRGRTACAMKRVAITVFDGIFARLAAHVNAVAAGDTAKLLTSGFEIIKKRAEPFNDLEAPTPKDFRFTQWENMVDWYWAPVQGALVYRVECAVPGEEPNWELVCITSKPKARVKRRQNDQFLLYRVCAIGSKLQGPFSGVRTAAAS